MWSATWSLCQRRQSDNRDTQDWILHWCQFSYSPLNLSCCPVAKWIITTLLKGFNFFNLLFETACKVCFFLFGMWNSHFPAMVLSMLQATGASLNKLWTGLINLIRRLKSFWRESKVQRAWSSGPKQHCAKVPCFFCLFFLFCFFFLHWKTNIFRCCVRHWCHLGDVALHFWLYSFGDDGIININKHKYTDAASTCLQMFQQLRLRNLLIYFTAQIQKMLLDCVHAYIHPPINFALFCGTVALWLFNLGKVVLIELNKTNPATISISNEASLLNGVK